MQSETAKIDNAQVVKAVDRTGVTDSRQPILGLRRGLTTPRSMDVPYSLHIDPEGAVRIEFNGKVDRRTVLALQASLSDSRVKVQAVHLDLSGAHDLNIRAIASLAMLCGILERKGIAAGLSNIPEKLRQEIMRAQLHHLVNLE